MKASHAILHIHKQMELKYTVKILKFDRFIAFRNNIEMCRQLRESSVSILSAENISSLFMHRECFYMYSFIEFFFFASASFAHVVEMSWLGG